MTVPRQRSVRYPPDTIEAQAGKGLPRRSQVTMSAARVLGP